MPRLLKAQLNLSRLVFISLITIAGCVQPQGMQQGGTGNDQNSGANPQQQAQGGGQNAYNEDAPAVWQNEIYDSTIRTVLFHKAGLQGSYPIMQLNGGDKLDLQFDRLGSGSATNYQFTIEHCDADWTPSNMMKSDYISGLFQDFVAGFSFSTNTYTKYVHYKLRFPTDNLKPKISGNYVLKIFEYDPNKPVLVQRFYVFEQLADVNGRVNRASYAKYRDTHQEIDFEVNLNNLYVMDPFSNIKVVLKKNWRFDNEITNLKPTYIRDKTLVYDYQEGNLFSGGSEYRPLDLRDVRFKGAAIKYWLLDERYTAVLYTDEDRSYTAYNLLTDQNGQFTITSRQGQDASTDADYVYVDFSFHPTYRDQGRDIYVFGALSNWEAEERFKMKYDQRSGDYTCRVMLKQGFYDYKYASVNEQGEIDLTMLEGNHWETENNYTVLVYYRAPNALGDALVGIQRLNTVVK